MQKGTDRTLFIIPEDWKQPECVSVNKLWYIHTVGKVILEGWKTSVYIV